VLGLLRVHLRPLREGELDHQAEAIDDAYRAVWAVFVRLETEEPTENAADAYEATG
jgi:hypothetical protein